MHQQFDLFQPALKADDQLPTTNEPKATKADRSLVRVSPPRTTISPEICLIAAVGPNNELGSDNKLPWRLPRDLRFFRKVTHKAPVLMGRKTFESLGRPLPNRHNIVITRNPHFSVNGVTVAHSIEEAISLAGDVPRIFVIGGGKTYRDALLFATEVFLTKIVDENPTQTLFPLFPHDVTFPELNSDWSSFRKGRKFLALSGLVPKKALNNGMYFYVEVFRRQPKQSQSDTSLQTTDSTAA